MIPTINKYAQHELDTLVKQGKRVVYKYVQHPVSATCPNCGDAGFLWFQEIRGPVKDLSYSGSSFTYHDHAWFRIVENYIYDCPACNTDNREKRFEYLWKNSGLEEHQRSWRLDYIKDMEGKNPAYKMGLALLQQSPKPNGLICLYGPYGRGKSGVMKSLVAQLVTLGVPAHYVRADDILQKIRSSYDRNTQINEEEIVDAYIGYQFLGIDEIGEISTSDWALAKLRAIIDRRYDLRNFKATMVVTNSTPDELWAYLSSRLLDGHNVLMSGKDLRGQNQSA